MLFEEIEDDFGAICGAYGIDRDIFPSIKGATFENKKQGEQSTYQSAIQTASNGFCNFLDQLLLGVENAEFYMDYSHLAVMQEDKQKSAQEKKTLAEAYSIMLRDGVISHDQYAECMNIDCEGDKKVLYNTSQQNNEN
jgi:hypothetical protein